jgi:hypothetical protein
MEKQCSFSDEDGNCLIAAALKQYVASGKIISMENDPDWSIK